MSTDEGTEIDYNEASTQYSAQIQDIETVCAALDTLLPHFENMRGYKWCHGLITDPNEQARVVIEKATSKLKEVTTLSEALTTAPNGRFGAFQREMVKDKLDVEMGILHERMDDLAKRRKNLEDLRKLMCGYAEVEYEEL